MTLQTVNVALQQLKISIALAPLGERGQKLERKYFKKRRCRNEESGKT